MEDLNNVPSSGTYGAAINEVNANFSLVVNAINSLEYATTKSKGIYNNGFTPSSTTLPNSASGDWCMVLGTGNTFPARIWTFNGTTWAQGGTWNPDGINLNDYATTSALNTAVANSLLQATARMGYGEATSSNNAYSVTIANYTLPTNGGNIRVKMPSAATGAATLNISSTGAKTIWYNGLAVSSGNTWEQGEIISVFYDGTKYMAYNSQGGGGVAGVEFYDKGYINANNTNQKFVFGGGNLLIRIKSEVIAITEGTEVAYNFPEATTLVFMVYDKPNNTFVYKGRGNLLVSDIVFATLNVLNGKVLSFADCPIHYKVDGVDVHNWRELSTSDLTLTTGYFISASTLLWNSNANAKFYSLQVSKGDMFRIKSNDTNGISVMLLSNIDIVVGQQAAVIQKFQGEQSKEYELTIQQNCYLYILKVATNTAIDRYPASLKKNNAVDMFGIDDDAIIQEMKSELTHLYKNDAISLAGSFIYATDNKWSINTNALTYAFPVKVGQSVTIVSNSVSDASIAFLSSIDNIVDGGTISYSDGWSAPQLVTGSQTFDVTEDGYLYVFQCGSNPASNRYPSDIIIKDSKFYTLSKRISLVEQELPNNRGLYNYYGEKPNFSTKKYNRKALVTLPTYSGHSGLHQAMAVYDDYLVMFTYKDSPSPSVCKAILYNIPNASKLAEITLPYSTYMRPHGNVLSFGNTLQSSNSITPLLYVSQWDEGGERGVLVYDITLSGSTYSATLVQAIVPNISNDIFGSGNSDWVVDSENGHLYSITYGLGNNQGPYTDDDVTNPTFICKFAIPSIVSGTVEKQLSSSDILEHFTVKSLPYRQGVCIANNKMMVQRGNANTGYGDWLDVQFIDLLQRDIVTKIPLKQFGGETEGIALYKGKLVMGWRENATIYEFDF